MRWKAVCVGLASALAVTAGCKQQCFISEEDLNNVTVTSMPANLANATPPSAVKPIIAGRRPPRPRCDDPDRKIRYISLAEAISIALEQGTIGNQAFGVAPSADTFADQQLHFTGNGVSLTDSIRVLALDPAAHRRQHRAVAVQVRRRSGAPA